MVARLSGGGSVFCDLGLFDHHAFVARARPGGGDLAQGVLLAARLADSAALLSGGDTGRDLFCDRARPS